MRAQTPSATQLAGLLVALALVASAPSCVSETAPLSKSIDIRDEITASEMAGFRDLLANFFYQPIPEKLELSGAVQHGDRKFAVLTFDSPDPQSGLPYSTVARLHSSLAHPDWAVSEINFHSQRRLDSQNSDVSVIGEVSDEELREIAELVSNYWQSNVGGDAEILSIASNSLPKLRQLPEYLAGKTPSAVYSVTVVAIAPEVSDSSDTTSFRIASSAEFNVSFRLDRTSKGELILREVSSTAYPGADTMLLGRLRQGITDPTDEAELSSRRNAAHNALPEELQTEVLRDGWLIVEGPSENAAFFLVAGGPSSGEVLKGVVNCGRVAGTQDPWQCAYQNLGSDTG